MLSNTINFSLLFFPFCFSCLYICCADFLVGLETFDSSVKQTIMIIIIIISSLSIVSAIAIINTNATTTTTTTATTTITITITTHTTSDNISTIDNAAAADFVRSRQTLQSVTKKFFSSSFL
jgi:hypothetical protein